MDKDENAESAITPPPVQAHDPAALRSRSRNYFGRHWRGELPLSVSYWINGVLGNILAIGVWIVPIYLTNIQSNYAAALGWSAFWVTLVLINIWQVVGIWRSASQHIKTTNRSGWARAAQIVMVIWVFRLTSAFMGQGIPGIKESFEQAWWLNENGKWDIRILKEGTELELSGGIGYGMTKDLKRFLDATPTVRLIHVNLASGGLVDEAKAARDLIHLRGLDTYTSGSCVSACTVVFMGGKSRYMKTGAKLGFHAFKKPGLGDELNEQTLTDESNYLTSIGVSPSFAQRVIQTPQPKMWYPGEEELKTSGVVTEFTDGDTFAFSGFGKVPNMEALESDFQGIRIYRALKVRHPEVYKDVLRASYEAFRNGQSAEDLRSITVPLINPVFIRDLPYGSDESLTRFGRLLVNDLAALQRAPGRICLGFISGKGTGGTSAALRFIPTELREEELEVMADVLESFDPDRPQPRQAVVDSISKRIMGMIREEVGDDALVVARMDDPSVDPATACRVALTFYSAIMSLPDRDRSVALRGAFAPN